MRDRRSCTCSWGTCATRTPSHSRTTTGRGSGSTSCGTGSLEIDTDGKTLSLRREGPLVYDKLLIATGSKSNKFGWPGQDLEGVQGLWGLQDLELLYRNSETCRRAVIVGGGLIGIELGEMLHSRGIHVTFLIREENYWDNILPREEAMMIGRLIRESGMELITETNLKEIVAGDDGRCSAVITEFGDRIDCEIVGLTPGVSPNIDLLEGSSIPTGRGVLVDWSLRTQVPDVLAAGDCAEIETPEGERNVIQQVWYTGKMQGRVAGEVMTGRAGDLRAGHLVQLGQVPRPRVPDLRAGQHGRDRRAEPLLGARRRQARGAHLPRRRRGHRLQLHGDPLPPRGVRALAAREARPRLRPGSPGRGQLRSRVLSPPRGRDHRPAAGAGGGAGRLDRRPHARVRLRRGDRLRRPRCPSRNRPSAGCRGSVWRSSASVCCR